MMDTKLVRSKKRGRDYFMWPFEEKIDKVAYRGKRISIIKTPKPITILGGDGKELSGIGLAWGCNIYGLPYGDYILVNINDFQDISVVKEVKDLLLEQMRWKVDKILFDRRMNDKLFYAYDMKEKTVAIMLENKDISWEDAFTKAVDIDQRESVDKLKMGWSEKITKK